MKITCKLNLEKFLQEVFLCPNTFGKFKNNEDFLSLNKSNVTLVSRSRPPDFSHRMADLQEEQLVPFVLTVTQLKGPAHFEEPAIGQRTRADEDRPTSGDGRQPRDEEDAPEGPVDREREEREEQG